MKAKDVTVYICDYCKKKLFRKYAMVNHELLCDKNPINNKACFGCIHLENEEVERYVDGYDGDYQTIKSGCFKCAKLDKLMFTWNAEKRGLPEAYPEDFEEQKKMPKECRHFSSYDNERYSEKLLTDLPF
jgi:hypothetical protein